MTSTTTITIIRHGETIWNADGRQQGQLDGDLNDLGQRQARAVAAALAHETYDALYTSDLKRAQDTAVAIAEQLNIKVKLEPRLRERHLGILQGMTLADFNKQYPAEYASFSAGDPDWVIPQGESRRQRSQRVIDAVNDIARQHPGENVILVTHGGVLDSIFRHTLALPLEAPRTYSLFNAGINVITINDGAWRLNTWGDIHHLRELGTIDDW